MCVCLGFPFEDKYFIIIVKKKNTNDYMRKKQHPILSVPEITMATVLVSTLPGFFFAVCVCIEVKHTVRHICFHNVPPGD